MEQHEQAESAPQIESDAVRSGYIVTQQLSRPDKGGLTPHQFWIASSLEQAHEAARRATAPPPPAVVPKPPAVEGPGWLMTEPEWSKIRYDTARVKLATAMEAPLKDRCQSERFQMEPLQVADLLWRGDDYVCAAQNGLEAVTKRFVELRGTLHLFHRVSPNCFVDRRSQAVRDRRFLCLKYREAKLDASWRRISSMAKSVPMSLCILNANDCSLESWHSLAGLDQNQVLNFAREALSLGNDPATLHAAWRAAMPGGVAPGSDSTRVFQKLREAQLVRDQTDFNLRQLANRNLVLWFDSFPGEPPKEHQE